MKTSIRLAHILILIVAGVVNALCYTSEPFGITLQAPLQLLTVSVLAHYVYGASTARRAFFYGMLYGVPSFAIGLSWLFTSMNVYGNLPAWLATLAVLLIALFLSLYYAIACWLSRFLLSPSKLLFAFTFASAWTLLEWIRGSLFTGFPWNNIAYAHLDGILHRWVPIFGSYGLCFVTALFAIALTLLIHTLYHHGKVVVLANLILGILISSILLELISWGSPIAYQAIPIRLIQPNSSVIDKFTPRGQVQDMEKILQLIAHDNINHFVPDIVILPETTFAQIQTQLPLPYLETLKNALSVTDTTAFIGMPLTQKREIYNGILQIDPETSLHDIYTLQTPFYTKQHLVPFGEYIPKGFKWFTDMMQIPLGDFNVASNQSKNFEVDGIKFTPTICYENLFGTELIDAVQDGGNILINLSNLIWFGKGKIQEQYLNISRMRSIEFARPMLLVSNTGITGHIDARGELVSALAPDTTAALDIWVQPYTHLTPFACWGNYPIITACIVILLMALVIRLYLSFKKQTPAETTP